MEERRKGGRRKEEKRTAKKGPKSEGKRDHEHALCFLGQLLQTTMPL
jgi:hypothetical protein